MFVFKTVNMSTKHSKELVNTSVVLLCVYLLCVDSSGLLCYRCASSANLPPQ